METSASDHAQPIPVAVTRRSPEFVRQLESLIHTDLETDLQRARSLANWLDAKFEVAGIRFGFDSIIGLVPGVGDTLTTLMGLYPLLVARRYKLGRMVQARMAMNLMADWAVGLIPIAGDVADASFKSHVRNVRLLEKVAAKRKPAEPTP